ncbi:MAG TPA: hypothetical protein VKM69_00290 [Natronoarchaeum rubrum]|nr:hypothetical protein [Natronoarchaeum rubrum]
MHCGTEFEATAGDGPARSHGDTASERPAHGDAAVDPSPPNSPVVEERPARRQPLGALRRPTAIESVRVACYAVAGLLVALPVIAFGVMIDGGSLASRVVLILLAEGIVGSVALLIVGVGRELSADREPSW